MKNNTINVQIEGVKVALVLNGRRLMDFGWRAGDDICKALDRQLRGALLETGVVRLGGGATVSFRTEGGTVLWINNGALAFSAVADDMRKIWRGVLAGCRKAEEQDKAERIILDNAILFRSGAPIGLSDNSKIREETVKEAVNNCQLRRYMPHGIKSTELHGTPRLILGDLPALERVSRLNPNETYCEQRSRKATDHASTHSKARRREGGSTIPRTRPAHSGADRHTCCAPCQGQKRHRVGG